MPSPTDIQALKEARRRKLAALMDASSKTALGKKLDMNPDYLWQMAKGTGKSARGVSDETARKIEAALEKPPHWLEWEGDEPPLSPPSQPAGLDLEMLRSAIVAVKESLRKADLVFDTYEAAPIIAFAYQERIKLPRELPKAKLREFDQHVWHHLQGELAHDAGQGRTVERGAEGATNPAASATKARGRRA